LKLFVLRKAEPSVRATQRDKARKDTARCAQKKRTTTPKR